MASVFANVEVGPKIEVFALTKAYQEDPSMVKVNLSVGGKLFTSIECMFYLFITFFSCVVVVVASKFKFDCGNFVELW